MPTDVGFKARPSSASDAVEFHADQVTIDAVLALVERVKVVFGVPGAAVDVSAANPLPITDAAAETTLTAIAATLTSLLGAEGGEATQTTLAAVVTQLAALTTANHTDLAAVLAKLTADPSTQTTLAAVLAKLSADPATQTTLAAIFAKLPAAPALDATVTSFQTASHTDLTAILAKQPATPALDGTDGATPPTVPGTGIRGWLRSIYDKLNGTLAVSGTFWQATQPVSAAALPLPSGAATDASLTNGNLRVGGTVAVTMASPGDIAATLTDGRVTVATPGTAVALRGSLACKWVTVTALFTNTSRVNVGGAGALATAGSSTGSPLNAGDSLTVPVNNAQLVFVDALVGGEGVSFTVGS